MVTNSDFIADGPVGCSVEISAESFGAKYTGFRNFDRFENQTSEIDLGLIHWPGGYLAELNDGRYGYEHQGLFDPAEAPGKLTIDKLFEFAVENSVTVAITLPTAKYQSDPASLAAEARPFFENLFSGVFGELPDSLIIELGNEFYSAFDGETEANQAEAYASVVNEYSKLISAIESEFTIDPEKVEYSIQLGRTSEGNDALLNSLSDDSLLVTDLLSHHRFPFTADGAGSKTDLVQEELSEFGDAIEALGGEAAGLFLSEYNAASLTRGEAAQSYLNENSDDPSVTLESLDLNGRSNAEFEQYYQDQLGERAYGLEQAETLLQLFSEYQAIGTEAMTTYGWDSVHAGRHSFEGSDDSDYLFVGGALQDMMAESLEGTRVLDWFKSNNFDDSGTATTTAFGFDSNDKLVIFLSAPDFESSEYSLHVPLDGLGTTLEVWGERLSADVPSDWKTIFNIPTSNDVDQLNEAETFSVASREDFAPDVEENGIDLTFTQPGQIIRLTFARTEEGTEEISGWHGDNSSAIEAFVEDAINDPSLSDIPDVPPDEEYGCEEVDDDDDWDDEGMPADGGAGAGGFAILLPLVLLLLL